MVPVFTRDSVVTADVHALAKVEQHVAVLGFDKTGKPIFAHITEGPAHGRFALDGPFGLHKALRENSCWPLPYWAILLSRFWM